MENESQMGPARYRIYMVIGIIAVLGFIATGIWGIVGSNEPLLGWIMLVAGVAIGVLSVVRLRSA
ncbi:hypothetical protein [Microbacterium lacus]|uniref:hypothetical protein n=1 Tax=Microbacterium lacus TaxID=415217 RepID=UPI0012FD5089|nr:hypothetical protein [Microbacterium lacus]